MKNKYNTLLFLALCLFGLINNSEIHADEHLSKSAWSLSLPEAVTSFGASRDEKFLYVYGGHVGDAHVYSKETHSKSFVRLNLKSKKKIWEKLPFNDPLQGFGMAAYKGRVFISGGSQATN